MRSIEATSGWNPREFFENYVFSAGHFQIKIQLSIDLSLSKVSGPVVVAELEGCSGISNGAKECETFIAFFGKSGLIEERRIRISMAVKKLEWQAPQGTVFAVLDPRATLVAKVEHWDSESMARQVLETYSIHGNGYFAWLASKSLVEKGMAHLKGVRELIIAWILAEGSPRARAAGYRLLGERLVGVEQDCWERLQKNEHVLASRAVLFEARADGADLVSALRIFDEAVQMAQSRSEFTVMRRSALLGLRRLMGRMPEMRDDGHLGLAREAGLVCLAEARHAGFLAAAASDLVADTLSDKALTKVLNIAQDTDLPGPTRRWALMVCARACVLYPERRRDLLPALRRYADALTPSSLVTLLPQVWLVSRDPECDELFQGFLKRKSYGLMSMRIPQARRAYRKFLGSLSANSLQEKLVAIEEISRRIDRFEHEFRLQADRFKHSTQMPDSPKVEKEKSKSTSKVKREKSGKSSKQGHDHGKLVKQKIKSSAKPKVPSKKKKK
jgi:hypothetical protein